MWIRSALCLIGVLAGVGCGGRVVFDGTSSDPSPDDSESGCPFLSPKDPSKGVLAWVRGKELVWLRADGTETTPYVFQLGAGGESNSHVEARDGFVAASRLIIESGPNGSTKTEVVLLNAAGTVLWSTVVTDGGVGWHYLGEEGVTAVVDFYEGAFGTRVIWPDGSSAWLYGIEPVSGPKADGTFAAYLLPEWHPGTLGWGIPNQEPIPVPIPPDWTGIADVADGSLYYVTKEDPGTGGVAVVRTSLSETITYPVPGDAFWMDVSPPHLLAQRYDAPALPPFAGDMDTGALKEMASLPAGFHGLVWDPRATLDEEGNVWWPLRNASLGGFYRASGMGGSWEQVGKTFTNVSNARVITRRNTVVLAAHAELEGVETWEPPGPGDPAPDMDGPGVQVLRPEEGIAWDLGPDAYTFSVNDTGMCVAFVRGDWQVHTLDMKTGEVKPRGAGSPNTLDIVWIQ